MLSFSVESLLNVPGSNEVCLTSIKPEVQMLQRPKMPLQLVSSLILFPEAIYPYLYLPPLYSQTAFTPIELIGMLQQKQLPADPRLFLQEALHNSLGMLFSNEHQKTTPYLFDQLTISASNSVKNYEIGTHTHINQYEQKNLASSQVSYSGVLDNERNQSTSSENTSEADDLILKLKLKCNGTSMAFRCEICGKTFAAHYNLTRHMPIHTVLLFSCSFPIMYFYRLIGNIV